MVRAWCAQGPQRYGTGRKIVERERETRRDETRRDEADQIVGGFKISTADISWGLISTRLPITDRDLKMFGAGSGCNALLHTVEEESNLGDR